MNYDNVFLITEEDGHRQWQKGNCDTPLDAAT